MGLIAGAHGGRRPMPPRIVLYGIEGIGKSAFGAGTPAPIFLPREGGLGEIDCHHFPPAESLAKKCHYATEVRPEGFEPSTYGSVGHCSVQLSYERLRQESVPSAGGVSSSCNNFVPHFHPWLPAAGSV
jgi:hypothetical protein